MTKALWLDDTIGSYNHIVEVFKDEGLDVTPAPTIEEAWSQVEAAGKRDEPFDVCIVDIALKEREGQDGIHFIDGLIKTSFPGAIVVLSAHLHRKQYRELVSGITHPVGVLEKSFQGGEERIKGGIIDKIKEWVVKRPTLEPKAYYEVAEQSEAIDPIFMSFARFDALPEYVQKELWDKAKEKARDAVISAMRNGARWVLICGSAKQPAKVIYKASDIPSEQDLIRFARDKGKAYYEFYRGHFDEFADDTDDSADLSHAFEVEEVVWRGACGPHRRDYPTVSIRFSNDSELIKSYHFDTGSSDTFFSYEELLDAGVIMPTRRSVPGRRRETKEKFAFVPQSLNCLIVDQAEPGKNTATSINAIVIKDWLKSSPFKYSCAVECGKGIDINGERWCRHRFGLVGRNILTGGDGVSLTLCGKSGRTRVG